MVASFEPQVEYLDIYLDIKIIVVEFIKIFNAIV